jgi:hypothetical protein
MPEMIMQRDKVVHCLSGHSIAFKKGEPAYVPPPAIAECMAVGAVPIEDLPVEQEDAAVKVVTDPAERKKLILEAFETLRKRDQRGDFDAAGKPHAKAVTAIVGFTVETKERNTVWTEYMEAANGG